MGLSHFASFETENCSVSAIDKANEIELIDNYVEDTESIQQSDPPVDISNHCGNSSDKGNEDGKDRCIEIFYT